MSNIKSTQEFCAQFNSMFLRDYLPSQLPNGAIKFTLNNKDTFVLPLTEDFCNSFMAKFAQDVKPKLEDMCNLESYEFIKQNSDVDLVTMDQYYQQMYHSLFNEADAMFTSAESVEQINQNDLFHMHVAPMTERDVKPEQPEPAKLVFSVSSVTTRDAILDQQGVFGAEGDDELRPALQWAEVVQASSTRAPAVFQILHDKLITKPAAWFKAHANIHFITDYDGVVKNAHTKHKKLFEPLKSFFKGSDESFQQEKNQYQAYDKNYKKQLEAYKQINHQRSHASIEAAKLGAYRPSEEKIGRILNAILNEDHPDKVHVFLDDREDILTFVFNFFQAYPHLIKGKLVLYKADKMTGGISLCQWAPSSPKKVKSGEAMPFVLMPPEHSPNVTNYQEFAKVRPEVQGEKDTYEGTKRLHADWLTFLTEKISEHVRRHFVMNKPFASSSVHDGSKKENARSEAEAQQGVKSDNVIVIQGSAPTSQQITFDKKHQLVSMLNLIFRAIYQANPEVKYQDLQNAIKHWHRFQEELWATHFKVRANHSVYEPLDKRGDIIPLAAVVTSRIADAIESCQAVSPQVLVADFLIFFNDNDPRLKPLDYLDVGIERLDTFSELAGWFKKINVDLSTLGVYIPTERNNENIEPMCLVEHVQKILQQSTVEKYLESIAGPGQQVDNLRFVSFADSAGLDSAFLQNMSFRVGDTQYYASMKPLQPGIEIQQAEGEFEHVKSIMYPYCYNDGRQTTIANTACQYDDYFPQMVQDYMDHGAEFILQSLGGETVFGNKPNLLNENRTTIIARNLLNGFSVFKEHRKSKLFFQEIAQWLNITGKESALIAEQMWQVILQALSLGLPSLIVAIPSGHQVKWYARLVHYAKYFLFNPANTRKVVRSFEQLEESRIVPDHFHLQAKSKNQKVSENVGFTKNYHPLYSVSMPKVDILIARFVALNPLTASAARLVTTGLDKIEQFMQQMIEDIFIKPRVGDQEAHLLHQDNIERYAIALLKLCLLPMDKGDQWQTFDINFAVARLQKVLAKLAENPDQETRFRYNYCLKLLCNHCFSLSEELQQQPLFLDFEKFYQAIFVAATDLNHFPLFDFGAAASVLPNWFGYNAGDDIENFLQQVQMDPALSKLFRVYTRPITASATMAQQSRYDIETTPEKYKQCLLGLMAACVENQLLKSRLLIILMALGRIPMVDEQFVETKLPAEEVEESFSADDNLKVFHESLEQLINQEACAPDEVFALYKYLMSYLEQLNNCAIGANSLVRYSVEVLFLSVFNPRVKAITTASKDDPSIIYNYIHSLVSPDVSSEERGVANFQIGESGEGNGSARSMRSTATGLSGKPSNTLEFSPFASFVNIPGWDSGLSYWICDPANWREFSERFALHYFDNQVPKAFWQHVHRYAEAASSLAPTMAAIYAIVVAEVRKAAENTGISNTTMTPLTTAAANDFLQSYDRPLTIAWASISALFALERLLALTGPFENLRNPNRWYRNVSIYGGLIVSMMAIVPGLYVSMRSGDDVDASYLKNLVVSMMKAELGAPLIIHVNGFATLIANMMKCLGCNDSMRRFILRSSYVLVAMAALTAGVVFTLNPLASMLYLVGTFSRPYSLPLQASGNAISSVFSPGVGLTGSLALVTTLMTGAYRMAPAYKALGAVILLAGAALLFMTATAFAIPLDDYINNKTVDVGPVIEYIYENIDAFMWGVVIAAVVYAISVVGIVEATQPERAPALQERKSICCRRSRRNDEKAQRLLDSEQQSLYQTSENRAGLMSAGRQQRSQNAHKPVVTTGDLLEVKVDKASDLGGPQQ